MEPWSRLFHNLRAIRETALTDEHPIHVVCAWIGNSPRVAREHYLQVTPEHFEKALQNPTHHPTARGGKERHEARRPREKPQRPNSAGKKLPPAGIEPAAYGLGNRRSIH